MNKSVDYFYNYKGWKYDKNGNSFDAISFEDLRKCSFNYLRKNRLKLKKYFPEVGNILLDCASGPIQYPEYLEYSKNYNKRVCIDFSEEALKIAKSKDPNKIDTIHGDILKIELGINKYTTILCIHTLYHICKKDQIKIIQKFKKSLAKNGTIIIIYSNPNFILEKIKRLLKIFRSNKCEFTFERFSVKEIKKILPEAELIPFRFLSGEDMRRILPNYNLTNILLVIILYIESRLPLFFVQYYLIKIKK